MKKSFATSLCPCIVLLALFFPLMANGGEPSLEKVEVALRDNEIMIQRGDTLRQLTHDGLPKFLPTLSPDGTKVVYHGEFKPYAMPKDKKPVEFRVLETRNGNIISRVEIEKLGRFLDAFVWIDDRWILVDSELEAMFDGKSGRVVRFAGGPVKISPDRKALLFVNALWPMHPGPGGWQRDQELRVLLPMVDDHGPTWASHRVFPPKVRNWDDGSGPANEDFYHRIGYGYAWHEDSRKIALIDEELDRKYLVVLTLNRQHEDVSVNIKRYLIGKRDHLFPGIKWLPDGSGVELEMKEHGRKSTYQTLLFANLSEAPMAKE